MADGVYVRFCAGTTMKSAFVTGSVGPLGAGKSLLKTASLVNGRGVPPSSYLHHQDA